MKRTLPDWCKEAKCELIWRDMGITELAIQLGISRTYVTQVLNGKQYAPTVAEKISKELQLDTPYPESLF